MLNDYRIVSEVACIELRLKDGSTIETVIEARKTLMPYSNEGGI